MTLLKYSIAGGIKITSLDSSAMIYLDNEFQYRL